MDKVNSKTTPHKDILMGVFRHGYFYPYGSNKDMEAQLDSNEDTETSIRTGFAFFKGGPIHGSFKDGNFRPAERKTTRRGYVHHFTDNDGKTYDFDYLGHLYERGTDKRVGYVTEKGEVKLNKKLGIESLLDVFPLFILGGLILSLFSMNITGNFVGAIGTTSGSIGIFLFVLGIAGMIFRYKRS